MEFKKLDTTKPYKFRSRYIKGSMGWGIFLIVFGIAFLFSITVWIVLFFSSLRHISAKPVSAIDIILITVCITIGSAPFFVVGSLLIALNAKFQAITEDILTNGLITTGGITKAESSNIISYVFMDDNGIMRGDYFKCRDGRFQQGTNIAVIFYNGLSLVLESYYCKKQ